MARKSTIQKGSVYPYRGMLRVKIRVPNVTGSDGKPKYMVKSTGLMDTANGRKLAKEMLDQMYADLYLGQGRSVASKRQLMSSLFEEFMASKRRMTSTEMNYKLAFKRIVRGDYPADGERIEDDIRYFVKNTTISQTSVNTYLRQFKAFLTWLQDERDVKVPRKIMTRFGYTVRTNVQDFTDVEIDLMLSNHQDPELCDMLIVMVETGARPVDVLTLKWDQVDLSKQTVTWLNKITKREEPRPISKKATESLRRRREAREGPKVFRWAHASLSPLTKAFKAHCASVGVDSSTRSLKHLRTTFKRRLMEKGLPFEVQMFLMRHSSPDVTLGSYTSITNSMLWGALDG